VPNKSADALLSQGDPALAMKIADLRLLRYPGSQSLLDRRLQALDR
jgi:hypothetical protein